MSYVWLPVDVNLLQNHKTARLSRDLKCSRAHVIGHLVCLWSWACVHAPDGDLSHLEAEDVATVAEWDGDLEAFLPAVIKAGFMDEAQTLHDWEEHQGAQFRKRLAEAARKRTKRDKSGTKADTSGTGVGQEWDKSGHADTTGQDRTGQNKTLGGEDALVALAFGEIIKSESTAEDYRRTINRHRGRLTDEHIERIIYGLADWKPKQPRAKLHLTLGKWLAKEQPEAKEESPTYPYIDVPEDW